MFIDPAPFNKAFDATDIETNEVLRYPAGHSKAGKSLFKRRFIPASLTDNPYLSESGDYEAMLLSLPEQQRRQLLEGAWDIKEGAALTEFNRDVHVVEPFDIPNNWVKFRACDYGYGSSRSATLEAPDILTASRMVKEKNPDHTGFRIVPESRVKRIRAISGVELYNVSDAV